MRLLERHRAKVEAEDERVRLDVRPRLDEALAPYEHVERPLSAEGSRS